ncbi:MAG: terminase large subunit [Reyranella sp.]|uniref:terminase large subunit n=1 Tax=Reyranella sp. TaxID=1929291 RepID=UPI003D1371DB
MSGNWDFALPDWEGRLRAGHSLLPDMPLDEVEAARAVAIFNKLRLPDVPGQPTLGEAAAEWQRDVVRAIFGSMEDGRRRVAEILAMVPKKSNKTTMGAAITLVALLMNERPRAEMVYVGPTQEIADTAFSQAVGMIDADPYLAKRFHVQHNTKTITDRRNKTRAKIKTFDMKVVTGSKPVFVLLDELHLMAAINGAGRIIGQIRGGMMPNPEAAMVMITTQSDVPPAGVFKDELTYARGVRDGRLPSGRLLPLLYEFPQRMQRDESWRDPKNWPMVSPSLGRPVPLDSLISAYEEARQKGDTEERRWVSQHLNIEVGVSLQTNRWPGAEHWEKQGDPTLTLDAVLDRSEVVVVGVDGGGLDDLFGVVVLGRDRETKHWLCWAHAWCHRGVLTRRQSIASRLLDFEKDGDLTIVDDDLGDIADIVDVVVQVRDRGLLACVAVDPAGIGELVDALAEVEITQDGRQIMAVSQGDAMMNAIKTCERKLANGTLRHTGSALAAWCVGNLKIEATATAIRATKQNAGDAKIDVAMGLFDAASVMSLNPEAQGLSVFDLLDDEPEPTSAPHMMEREDIDAFDF